MAVTPDSKALITTWGGNTLAEAWRRARPVDRAWRVAAAGQH